ncbi:MAG: hypothetical protein QXR45_14940 [Candidatus Bathyarchaeia archaeon]
MPRHDIPWRCDWHNSHCMADIGEIVCIRPRETLQLSQSMEEIRMES